MNKKILVSLAVIGVAAAIAIGGTIAYFSDTETSTGNTFTAGTIDISIDGQNPWTGTFAMDDMKPCYTDYINFRIDNDLSDPNPVNIFKKITVTDENTGAVSEPECDDQGGVWDRNAQACDWDGSGTMQDDDNDLSSAIWYDLYVEVYDDQGNEVYWYQTIYSDSQKQSIDAVYGDAGFGGGSEIFLGMIPAGGYMLVEQSYHLNPEAGNEYQGDVMTFDIEVKGVQLHGTAWLESKDTSVDPWLIKHDGFEGTLTYKVKHPTFAFSFVGKAPKSNHDYDLIVINDVPNDKGVLVGTETSDGSGVITITGDLNTGDLKDAKVWLITAGVMNPVAGTWGGWSPDDYLWETGLIWYEDTDL